MDQIKVMISLDLDDKIINTIAKALEPDNVNFPEGLSIDMLREDDRLRIIFTCKEDKIDSMLASIDEVLEHISIMLKVISDA